MRINGAVDRNRTYNLLITSQLLYRWATTAWWSVRGSNPRPYACKAYALPAELTLQDKYNKLYLRFLMVTRTGFKPVNARVKGVCVKSLHQRADGGHSRDRTYDQPVNSRLLYRWAMWPQLYCIYKIVLLYYIKKIKILVKIF